MTEKLLEIMSKNEFDFIDFGCSNGGSIEFAKKHFNAKRGLGLDINPEKVNRTLDLGYDAVEADVTQLSNINCIVDFVIMSHFLEHLPSYDITKSTITSAINISKSFVFIQQPFFDADGYLMSHGHKQYWSDWSGHPNRMTSLELHNILSPLLKGGKIKGFRIYAHKLVKDSFDHSILSINEKINQHKHDPKIHSTKEFIKYIIPIFWETKVVIATNENFDFSELERKFQWTKLLFST